MAATHHIKRVYLLYNPHAGCQQSSKILKKVLQFFEDHHIDVELLKTERPWHGKELAQQVNLEGHDAFCVIGGDGTLHEVVNGLMLRPQAQHIPLAVIPGGTGNSLANDLGLSSVDAALAALLAGKSVPMDLGEIRFRDPEGKEEQRYFLNLVGLGMGVRANLTAENLRWLGFQRYNAAILYHIAQNKGLRVEIVADGTRLAGLSRDSKPLSIVMIQNTVHGGKNLILAPAAKIDDGSLDLVFAPQMGRLKMISLFNRVTKDGSHVKEPGVHAGTFKTLSIRTPVPEPINMDGENYGTTPVDITVKAKQLEIIR
jgi:YegS/Rv2252/BmrU family lipid kinase